MNCRTLVGACLAAFAAVDSTVVVAEEFTVVAQELGTVRSSGKVETALWTRRRDGYTLQVLLPRGTLRYPFLLRKMAKANAVDPAHPEADPSRGQFFIGNTIHNLRGLDPNFGEFTVMMVDGRRAAPGTAPLAATAGALPPVDVRGIRLAPSATAPKTPPSVQVWLLRADGSIAPASQSAEPTAENGCDSTCMADEMLYRFSAADGAAAVAAAISIDGEFYIEKLRPLESTPVAR